MEILSLSFLFIGGSHLLTPFTHSRVHPYEIIPVAPVWMNFHLSYGFLLNFDILAKILCQVHLLALPCSGASSNSLSPVLPPVTASCPSCFIGIWVLTSYIMNQGRGLLTTGCRRTLVRKHLTRGFLCAVLDLSGTLWPLLISEYSGIKRRGTLFLGLRNSGISHYGDKYPLPFYEPYGKR